VTATDLLHEAEADRVMRGVHEAVHRYPPGFPGLRASLLLVTAPGDAHRGWATVAPGRGPLVELDAPAQDRRWCEAELASLTGHRWHSDYDAADGRHPKRLGPPDGSPLGAEVVIGDAMASRYRVRDGRIAQVTRTAGGTRFSIVIGASEEAPGGGTVSTDFTVAFWDVATGRLVRTDAYRDRYVPRGELLLPASRRVATADDDGIHVREVVLDRHELLDGEGA
jgi:hypothetical protein